MSSKWIVIVAGLVLGVGALGVWAQEAADPTPGVAPAPGAVPAPTPAPAPGVVPAPGAGAKDDGAGVGVGRGFLRSRLTEIRKRLAARLDLTDAQKAEIKQIIQEDRPAIRAALKGERGQIKEDVKKIHEAVKDGDKPAAQAARKDLRTLIGGLDAIKQLKEQVFKILTPEQQQKIEAWKEKHQAAQG